MIKPSPDDKVYPVIKLATVIDALAAEGIPARELGSVAVAFDLHPVGREVKPQTRVIRKVRIAVSMILQFCTERRARTGVRSLRLTGCARHAPVTQSSGPPLTQRAFGRSVSCKR